MDGVLASGLEEARQAAYAVFAGSSSRNQMKKILVIDDEPTLVATIEYNLKREGYQVATAIDGETGLSVARAEWPDLILLDLMLPGLDGFEVCRILRRETMAPILMLTAKTDEVDKVVGLELGADDYVTKPFSMRELLARVRALLRRAEVAVPDAGVALPDDVEQLDVGDLQVDLRSRTVYRSGAKLALTLKGYELLVFLLSNRGRAFTRKDLLDRIWGYHFLGDSRTVDVHVRWLRERIEENPAKPRRLITVRGFGYRFDG